MSINQLELTAELITELFKENLVSATPAEEETSPKTDTVGSQSQTKYLGKFKSKILVLVNEANVVFLQDKQLEYLTKILNACGLTVEDIALINLANEPHHTYRTLHQEFPSTLLLLFGVTPTALQLPIDFPCYQLQKLERSIFLQAPALQQVEASKPDREKLWQSLKKYFNV